MARVLKDLVVVTGTYPDRNGQEKNRYQKIGVLIEGERDGETYQRILMNKTFNPAGVHAKEGSDRISIALYEPRREDGQQDSNLDSRAAAYRNASGRSSRPSGPAHGADGRANDPDDEIPF